MLFVACKPPKKEANKKFTVVTTTTMITDLVKKIGGNAIEIKGIMGAGVDPHLYKASAGDLTKLSNADLIVYNGLSIFRWGFFRLQDTTKHLKLLSSNS